jgi:uncharacterized protein YdaU (DUF1376 family)
MPLWTDAYMAATSHLTFEEHGVYMGLLMMMWRTPGCRIPNEQAWIERRFRIDNDQYENLFRPIIIEFLDSTGNWITSRRLQKEYDYVLEKSQKQSVRSNARWLKEKELSGGNAAPAYAGTSDDLHESSVVKKTVSGKALKTNGTRLSDGNAPIPIPIEVKKELPNGSSKEKRKGTRIPSDWSPDDTQFIFACDLIGATKTHDEIAKFKDHWAGVAGQRGTKRDWAATWRNWVRRSIDFAKSDGNRQGAPDLLAAVGAAMPRREGGQGLQSDRISDDPRGAGKGHQAGGQSAQSKLIAHAKAIDPPGTDPAQGEDEDAERHRGRVDPDAVSLCG